MKAARAKRQPPATKASPGTGCARKDPQEHAGHHRPPDRHGQDRPRLDRVCAVRKCGGERSESNCYGDQMTTGEELNARSADLDSCARKRLRRHAIHPIGALRALAAIVALAAIAAPVGAGPERLPGPRPVRPLDRRGASGKNKKKNARPELEQLRLARRPGARPDHRGGSSGGDTPDSSSNKKKQNESKDKSSKEDKNAEDSSAALPPVGSGGDDDDDDGALSSASSTLTDWDEPLVPGLVALAALLTLGASVFVLVRRRRDAQLRRRLHEG